VELRCHVLNQIQIWRREHFFDDADHIEAKVMGLVHGAHAALSQHSRNAIPILQQLVYLEHFLIMAHFSPGFHPRAFSPSIGDRLPHYSSAFMENSRWGE